MLTYDISDNKIFEDLGVIVLRVNENAECIQCSIDTGYNLTCTNPEDVNDSDYWKKMMRVALDELLDTSYNPMEWEYEPAFD